MLQYGLIGEKLSHSVSPQIHEQIGTGAYRLMPMPPEALDDFFRRRDFAGINVTIPYKKVAMSYCDEISPQAAAIGCVNTICQAGDGRLIGHNTDYDGFRYLLGQGGFPVRGCKALVLGSGGASLTVRQVLKDLGAAQVVIISRSGEDNYDNLAKHADTDLIVNTTPVGMYPKTGQSPVSLDLFPSLKGVADLIYNPLRTALLLEAEKRGIPCAGGLGMLVAQAVRASELFRGIALPDETIPLVERKIRCDMENIILIGMPGSGKSTQGRWLAEALGREFLDTDAVVEQRAGCRIPEIFAKAGEDAFRKAETVAAAICGSMTGKVIATGGGIVTRPENWHHLKQNGYIIFLDRRTEYLSTKGRPLSTDKKRLEEMSRERRPMYMALAREIIPVQANPAATQRELRRIVMSR